MLRQMQEHSGNRNQRFIMGGFPFPPRRTGFTGMTILRFIPFLHNVTLAKLSAPPLQVLSPIWDLHSRIISFEVIEFADYKISKASRANDFWW